MIYKTGRTTIPTDILDKAEAALEGCGVGGVVACYCDKFGRRGLLWGGPAREDGWIPAFAGMTEVRGNDREEARVARKSGSPPTR